MRHTAVRRRWHRLCRPVTRWINEIERSRMASQRTKHQRDGGNGALGLQQSAKEVGKYLRDGSRAVTHQAKAALAAAAEQVRDEAQRLFDHRKGKAAVRIDAVGDAAQRVSHALHA